MLLLNQFSSTYMTIIMLEISYQTHHVILLLRDELGRKTWAAHIKVNRTEGAVSGLKVNFPDVQFVITLLPKNKAVNEIRAFWT